LYVKVVSLLYSNLSIVVICSCSFCVASALYCLACRGINIFVCGADPDMQLLMQKIKIIAFFIVFSPHGK
jgi:hypothetical protein